ncbi:ATP-binding cassette subfamily B protein [Murinocardiopsis flavida]|uniref:ATP-binding cassette subfamily B protein n=1 Tax=Murinocardiopsis flavida TaxID=645275 RepID=A0A2P8DLS4_9ACTN|nr:ABC transporter ATP-binding protein [Murinocardiopsis flavida]PSK98193.1 ATP-binding cassette subfamily B protein [Murinocardiopsis flavida]
MTASVTAAEQPTPPAEEHAKAPLRRLLEYARPHTGVLVFGGVLTFAGGLTGLAQPLVAKLVIDALSDGASLTRPLLLLGALVVGGAVLTAIGMYVLERTAQSIVLAARSQLVARLLRLRVAEVDRLKPGDLVSRVTADTTLLRSVATSSISQAVSASLLLLGGLVLMAVMDLVLFGVTIAVLLGLAVVMGVVMPRINRATIAGQAAIGEMGSLLERAFGAFRTVKANGAEAAETRRLDAAALTAWRKGVDVAGWTALSGSVAGLAVNLAFLTVLGVGGARVAADSLEISSLIAFLLLLFYLIEPISGLVQAATEVQGGLAAIHRIDEVGTLRREHTEDADTDADTDAHEGKEAHGGENGDRDADGSGAAAAARRAVAGNGAAPRGGGPVSVAFDGVGFRYTPDLPPVHRGVTFEAPAGGLTALVGPSGAGKTTVFSLLERFYDATSGRVLVDGADVRDWPLAALRSAIAYVEQDAPVLDGTLRENLLLGAPDADDDAIAEVVRRARLGDLTERLPDGVDSLVGHRGTTISGGERQRVAIARALLRRPRLLLMDEATSQLDAANEAALKQVMLDAARETSVMVVAHRLSTVVRADRIVVLDAGAVRAVGTHAELVAADELYSDLAASQFLTADA